MSLNILVIGGVALGPKAAARAKRLLPDSHITMIDQEPISLWRLRYPYFVGSDVARWMVCVPPMRRGPRRSLFKEMRESTPCAIHGHCPLTRRAKKVTVENTETGEQSQLFL
jgi:hypothetical protein